MRRDVMMSLDSGWSRGLFKRFYFWSYFGGMAVGAALHFSVFYIGLTALVMEMKAGDYLPCMTADVAVGAAVVSAIVVWKICDALDEVSYYLAAEKMPEKPEPISKTAKKQNWRTS